MSKPRPQAPSHLDDVSHKCSGKVQIRVSLHKGQILQPESLCGQLCHRKAKIQDDTISAANIREVADGVLLVNNSVYMVRVRSKKKSICLT